MVELLFPLRWPAGAPRTPNAQRTLANFSVDPMQALLHMEAEIGRAGGRSPVLLSNLPVTQKGGWYKGAAASLAADPGVVVHFVRKGKTITFAVDRYIFPWQNWRAIGLAIEAMRALERHGGPLMLDAAFEGFTALPGVHRAWWTVLGLPNEVLAYPPATRSEAIARAYKAKARAAAESNQQEALKEINVARDEGMATCV